MQNIKLTLLDENQVFGSNGLDIIKKYGTKCAITDFAILLGGYVSSDFYTSEGYARKDRIGWWWTKSSEVDDDVRVVYVDGDSSWHYVFRRFGGVRPVLPYSSIAKIFSNEAIAKSEIKEVFYGEYPQMVASEKISCELENQYNNGTLESTGKCYTTDSVEYQDTEISFKARKHLEYIYNGVKYIRFVGDSNCYGDILSDGQKVQTGSIEVTEMVDRVKTNGEVQFNNRRQSLFDQFEPYIYNSSLSNSNMDVYRMKWNKYILSNGWRVPEEVGYYYVAISKDKRRMVTWKEAHGSNEIIDKQEYIEVSIDDVINGLNPKPSSNINRDFLYE